MHVDTVGAVQDVPGDACAEDITEKDTLVLEEMKTTEDCILSS